MLQNKLNKGKTIILDFLKTKLNLESGGTISTTFLESEYEMCLKLFCHIWKMSVALNCNMFIVQSPTLKDIQLLLIFSHYQTNRSFHKSNLNLFLLETVLDTVGLNSHMFPAITFHMH